MSVRKLNPQKLVFDGKGDAFQAVPVPRALRCAFCTENVFQAFKDDPLGMVAYRWCSTCNGKGVASIPSSELGL